MSHRNRQDQYKEKRSDDSSVKKANAENPMAKFVENGIPVELVGLRVVEAIEAGEFYIFTHPGHRKDMAKRAAAIDGAFERAAASPLLVDVPDEVIPSFG